MRFFIVLATFLFLHGAQANLYWGDILEQVDFEKVDLTRPVGAYKKLMEWKLPKLEVKELYQCLIYKVPQAKERGTLYLRTFHEKGCRIGGHFEEKILLKTSSNLRFKSLTNYSGLHLQAIDGSNIIKLSFPQGGSSKRWKSLHFDELDSLQMINPELKSGDYCLKWKKSCEPEISYQCSSCPSGQWSESMNYKECPSKVTAICGERSCGGKNQPACLKMVSLKYPLTCEEALEFVVCEPMLMAHCEGTGEIICR